MQIRAFGRLGRVSELTLRANVSSEFGSGSVTFAADGAIKNIDYVGD